MLLTDEVCEEVVRYESGSLSAAMTVVDADECCGGACLHLAVVLQRLVGLHDGERELARRVAPEVPRPQQVVGDATAIIAAVLILPRTRVPPDRAQARGRNLRQPRPHPSFPTCLAAAPRTPEPHRIGSLISTTNSPLFLANHTCNMTKLDFDGRSPGRCLYIIKLNTTSGKGYNFILFRLLRLEALELEERTLRSLPKRPRISSAMIGIHV